MCSIRDIVEIRAVNPPVQLWTVRRSYRLYRDEDNRLCATFLGEPIQGESIQYRTNEILVDALESGEMLENGCSAEAVFTAWVEKYGFTPTLTDEKEFSGLFANGIINSLALVYTRFCMFLKARYGYDIFKNKAVENASASTCAAEFFISTTSRKRVVFDGCMTKAIREDSGLLETLLSLLADYVTTDNGWQPFTCKMCGETSIRRNPKQCYCSKCSSKRYQITRQKKRLEGK